MTSSKIILILILSLSLSCVRYSFKGALPSYLKNIYIHDFDNQTQYPNVGIDLLNAVTEAFVQDNSLKVINQEKGADLILEGSVASISKQPVSITAQEQVQEFHMVVSVKAECMNTHTQKPLWSTTLSRYGVIGANALQGDIERAINEAIDQIVEDMITNTIAAW